MPKKVLLIEYEPRYVERIGKLLAPLGLSVTEAHDGEAGLQAFGASRFDLVLLSGMLPRLPSAEVIREIRKKGGATAPPIILMMSGYRGSNRKADAQKVGAFDILARPFNDEDFLGVVREAVESVDISARTMRIDTRQVAEASPLTSSDLFSDLLEELVGTQPAKASSPEPTAGPAAPEPPPAPPVNAPETTEAGSLPAPTPPAPAAAARPAGSESEIERRLRETLTELRMGRRAEAGARSTAPAEAKPVPGAPTDSTPPPATPARSKLSSDTDVDRILSDTLGGVLPRPRTGTATPPPAVPPSPPRKREEPEAAVPSSGPDRFGQYEILERIASGGMAELSKAKRTGVEGFQKIVAIKKILPHLADDEEFITMFADEAKLAAQLNHPNIIHIYDLGKIQAGGYFIAMEYVDGRDLRTILRAGRALDLPLPVPLAVYIASKVASALDYAHRRRDAEGHELNIVHRDVSPQNILISYEGDIKLCDFGIAKAARKASQTQSGALKGKLQYMSPEQAWGRTIDRRSDLFSLGIVLHEMLTGQHLFQGDTDIAILEKVRSADVAPPSRSNPDVPENLDAIVGKALAKDPDERYANASDLLRDLESVLYSYTPAPGSADVAIYLHRVQAEEAAVAETKAREAVPVPPEPAQEPARKRRSKGAPVSRRPAAPPPPPPPAVAGASAAAAEPPPPKEHREPAPSRKSPAPVPEVFGSRAAAEPEPGRAGRAPLYIGIGVAAVALVGFLVWKLSKPQPQAAAPVAALRTPAAATPLPTVEASPLPTAPPVDQKAVEAEVQRQLALKRLELEKTAIAARRAAQAAAVPTEAVATPEPALEAPTPVPTEAPTLTPRPQPTAVPTQPPPTVRPVLRGDLVGPGPGVVEPELEAPPRIVYPPLARQQRVSGRVVVLVLVDEDGKVAQAKLQQGIPGQAAVDNAVVEAIRGARFRAATKDGIPVKMWRPVVVEVKP
jgi:TonB family protein